MTNEEAAIVLGRFAAKRAAQDDDDVDVPYQDLMEAIKMGTAALLAHSGAEEMREAAAGLVDAWDHERSLAALADQIRALPIPASPCFVCDGDGVLHAEREGPDRQIVPVADPCPNCQEHPARKALEEVLRREMWLHYADPSQSAFVQARARNLASECLSAICTADAPKAIRDWVYEYDERLVSGHIKEPLIGTVAGLECDLRSWIRQEYGL